MDRGIKKEIPGEGKRGGLPVLVEIMTIVLQT